jgi:hypothetical protein
MRRGTLADAPAGNVWMVLACRLHHKKGPHEALFTITSVFGTPEVLFLGGSAFEDSPDGGVDTPREVHPP